MKHVLKLATITLALSSASNAATAQAALPVAYDTAYVTTMDTWFAYDVDKWAWDLYTVCIENGAAPGVPGGDFLFEVGALVPATFGPPTVDNHDPLSCLPIMIGDTAVSFVSSAAVTSKVSAAHPPPPGMTWYGFESNPLPQDDVAGSASFVVEFSWSNLPAGFVATATGSAWFSDNSDDLYGSTVTDAYIPTPRLIDYQVIRNSSSPPFNPLAYGVDLSTNAPRVGEIWTPTVDRGIIPGPASVLDVWSIGISTVSAEIPLPIGTLLIGPPPALVVSAIDDGVSGPQDVDIPVPDNCGLAGVSLYTQAALLSFPDIYFTNAIDTEILP